MLANLLTVTDQQGVQTRLCAMLEANPMLPDLVEYFTVSGFKVDTVQRPLKEFQQNQLPAEEVWRGFMLFRGFMDYKIGVRH